MLAYPEMLVGPAEKAGIKVPADIENYDTHEYPHWHVYLILQLGRSLPSPTSHWTNAKVVASVPEDTIRKLNLADFREIGFEG